MTELAIRFVAGGALVALFAVLGDIFTPKSFAGLFAAAPSVALATMLLTLHKQGSAYVSTEARSMIVGAVAFTVARTRAWIALPAATLAWAAVAAGVWYFRKTRSRLPD